MVERTVDILSVPHEHAYTPTHPVKDTDTQQINKTNKIQLQQKQSNISTLKQNKTKNRATQYIQI